MDKKKEQEDDSFKYFINNKSIIFLKEVCNNGKSKVNYALNLETNKILAIKEVNNK
jgi:hypothetical protein